MLLFYKENENFFKKYSLSCPDIRIEYFDNALDGPKNSNFIKDIMFEFPNDKFYSIKWNGFSDKVMLLYMIYGEVSGQLDIDINYFEFDGIKYTDFSQQFLDHFISSKCRKMLIYCDKENLHMASSWVRYISGDYESFYRECRRDLK